MIRMNRIDSKMNMDRYYSIQLTTGLFGDFGLERHWGRNGTWGRFRLDWFQSELEAENALSNLVNEKLTKGYTMKHAARDYFSQDSVIEI